MLVSWLRRSLLLLAENQLRMFPVASGPPVSSCKPVTHVSGPNGASCFWLKISYACLRPQRGLLFLAKAELRMLSGSVGASYF
ncbi:hypothetical protein Dfer_0770 [Dyadobacter fermentans DSM 18053]|uniref:Uncharacterized protein n=1 Tax=Dyadobacter fermentans (strain ATCC 700827 / DSM 18053 / CIP 107007 / KCTC 52180 / NS114) TaxID=471854 RepID=C6W257_DYAFD|nr:hypothetical protein Dfer_0770 [Dyadobacter fermentans DSM 18053]